MELKVIARVRTDFPSKFGIPRQSGLADTKGYIVFEPEFRNDDMLAGMEEYSHLWIIWGFSEHYDKGWSPMVRPPRLGGNEKRGVFATRSPIRPNPIGLSCVRVTDIINTEDMGSVICVSGVDMVDDSPVYDIKPYLPYVEALPEATGGFAQERYEYRLDVVIPKELEQMLPEEHVGIIRDVLSQDPRPAYQNDPERVYGMEYMEYDIRFRIKGNELIICEVCKNIEKE